VDGKVTQEATLAEPPTQRYIRKFARANARALNRLPTAFVSVCGAAKDAPDEARKYVETGGGRRARERQR